VNFNKYITGEKTLVDLGQRFCSAKRVIFMYDGLFSVFLAYIVIQSTEADASSEWWKRYIKFA
jgi:hypothetical protein